VPKEKEKNTRYFRLSVSIISGVLFILIIIGVGIYYWQWQNYFINTLTRVVPYPAATVNYSHWVSLYDYNENSRAMRKFLEAKGAAEGRDEFDFSTQEGLKRLAIVKKNILEQLIDNEIVQILAKRRGIKVTNEEAEELSQFIISQKDTKEGFQELEYFYGWDKDDFKKRVGKNLLYREKLENYVKVQGELDKTAKTKVNKVKEELTSGANFEDMVEKYSETPSKKDEGLLPAFARNEVPKEFADTAFDLELDSVAGPVEVDEGWHFIKLVKKVNDAGVQKVQVKHILILRRSFDSWLEEQKKEFSVKVPLELYFWHPQMGRLYFEDDRLNQVEDEWKRQYMESQLQAADLLLKYSNIK